MVKVTWYGHAAWLLEFSSKKILVDPFIKDNPKSPVKPENLPKVDFIVVTHAHEDHLGDAFEISKKTGAKIITIFENMLDAAKNGVPEDNLVGMNIGSQVDFNGVKIGLTQAVHSANCAGTVITGDSKTIYHAGDTGLFGDMKLIGDLYRPDAAMLPIGGFFTMSPKEAAVAARMIGAKYVFPMHYGTWPLINGDPQELKNALDGSFNVVILKPGESFII